MLKQLVVGCAITLSFSMQASADHHQLVEFYKHELADRVQESGTTRCYNMETGEEMPDDQRSAIETVILNSVVDIMIQERNKRTSIQEVGDIDLYAVEYFDEFYYDCQDDPHTDRFLRTAVKSFNFAEAAIYQ